MHKHRYIDTYAQTQIAISNYAQTKQTYRHLCIGTQIDISNYAQTQQTYRLSCTDTQIDIINYEQTQQTYKHLCIDRQIDIRNYAQALIKGHKQTHAQAFRDRKLHSYYVVLTKLSNYLCIYLHALTNAYNLILKLLFR